MRGGNLFIVARKKYAPETLQFRIESKKVCNVVISRLST